MNIPSQPHNLKRAGSGAPDEFQKRLRQGASAPASMFAPPTTGSDPRLVEHTIQRFTDIELDEWNEELQHLRSSISELPMHVAMNLATVVETVYTAKPGAINGKYRTNIEAKKLVASYPELTPLMLAASKTGDFRPVIKAEALLPSQATTTTWDSEQETSITFGSEASKEAAVKSWHRGFRGSTDALYNTIQQYTRQETPQPYARYAAYAQSSGTGKSRMNDELAKKVLYIPVNLGPVGGDVFPPADVAARQCFFTSTKNQQRYGHRMQAFIYSLFETVLSCLRSIEEEPPLIRSDVLATAVEDARQRVTRLANAFRMKMNSGMQFGHHGEYRVAFYESVAEGAKNFLPENASPKLKGYSPSMGQEGQQAGQDRPIIGQNKQTVRTAAKELIQFLGPIKDAPLVILCFDESHTLTKPEEKSYTWTPFSELRRVLRMIVDQPIFSLFLSTVGKLEQFAPHRQQETSGRIVMQRLDLFPPIIINPFDVLAERISGSGWTLQQVASTHHMVHLGRPLFAAMYDAGNDKFQETIVNFAKIKLLCSQDEPVLLTEAQSLACIGIRIPLEFKACVPADLENERILVAKHLRLLLYAGRGFAGVITSCPSEPLLAEAAYMVLATRRWSNGEAVEHPREEKSVFLEPMDALSYHIGHSHLDLGTRGETVAAILLLDARDRATTFPLADGELPPGTDNIGDNENRRYDGAQKRRIVTVTQFLRALLAEPYHDITPAEYHRPEYSQMRLEAAFNNCFIYFNHFVKAHKFDMVNQTYLKAAISRGMAFICAENQGGIDIIIPCLFGTELVREKVSAIMIQVKNDRRFKAKVDPTLFACMDPYRCGVFKSGVKEPPPVLRMVFALASGKSSVEARSRGHHPSTRSTQTAKFTAYDIWCAGARQSTFGDIQQGEEDALDNLLTILRGPHDIERLFKDVNVVRILQPGLSTGHGHFEQWFDLEDDMVDEEFEVSEPEDAVAGAE